VALRGVEGVGADTGDADVRLAADSPVALGRALARLEVALWGEGLEAIGAPVAGDATDADLTVTDRR
jgi:coenzyme F420-0:L-glutamate ligase/coenzyme F420-1:gamma-L-glutamate ligase